MTTEFVPYGARLRELADTQGDVAAIVFLAEDGSEQQVTFRELDHRSTQLARALAKRGVGLGDRLAIKLRNSPEHYIASFATWKLGATPTPMRWDLPEWEQERVLAVLDPKYVLSIDDGSFEEAAAESTDPLPDVVSPNSQALLSSGSTGTPKVILRTVPAVYVDRSPHTLIEAYGELSRPQLIVVPAPLYHNNGFMSTSYLLYGDRVVLLERFNAARMLDAIGRHGVTGFVATTVMLQRLAREETIDSTDFSKIEWVMHGAAPLPDWLARKWIELVGPPHFYVCWGSSEGLGATFANGDEYLEHPGTVGKGAIGTMLKILDDDGNELPTGEVGHIYVKSPTGVISKYVGNVAAIPVTPDGYASIGDMGSLDAGGYLFLADRRVDMVISGGANVFPAEVEAALSEHPGVRDVVVIGLPDPEWGQKVHAIVVKEDPAVTEADLIAYAKQRLSPYKVPKSVEFVDAIPRSEAFKVNRGQLIAARTEAK